MASFKHVSNGKVQITITYGKKFNGEPNRFYRTVDYTTDKQLEIDAALFLADVVSGNVTISSAMTVDAVFSDFIDNCTDLKASTTGRYKTLYSHQIQPAFGKRKINTITKPDVRKWVNHLLQEGHAATKAPLAPKTVKNALSLLSAIYNYAIDELEIIEKNPCERVKVPKLQKPATVKEFYSEEEIVKLIELLQDAMDDPRCITPATVLMIILFTGMRTGEVMGLTWNDVDLDTGRIRIESERVYISDIGVMTDTPKTDSSTREISIPTFLVDILKRLNAFQADCKLKMGEDYQDSGFVAVTVAGTPLHPRSTYKWFRNFLQRNGMKPATVHDLRHTHAAMLSSMGVKIIDISKRLGHSNTRITQEVYEYLFKNVDDSISSELDDYYKKLGSRG